MSKYFELYRKLEKCNQLRMATSRNVERLLRYWNSNRNSKEVLASRAVIEEVSENLDNNACVIN